jgi:hypothetical protein
MTEPFGPALEVDAPPAGRSPASRVVRGAMGTGGITAVALAAQAVLEAYLPVWLTRLEPAQVPIVAAGVVAGLGILVGGVWGLVSPAVQRTLGTVALLFVVVPLSGCIARVGPVVLGVGAVESCSGAYSYSEDRGWRCEGEYVAGAAISEQGTRVVGGAVDVARGAAGAVLGIPAPPKVTGP